MQVVQRHDVEFDICPQCRGIWLDRGELEKLMERERTNSESEPRRTHRPSSGDWPAQDTGRRDHDRDSRRDDRDHDHEGDSRRKKRSSIFDIFD